MILDEITAATKKRVEICKQKISLEEMKRNACSLPVENEFPFEINDGNYDRTYELITAVSVRSRKLRRPRGLLQKTFLMWILPGNMRKRGQTVFLC